MLRLATARSLSGAARSGLTIALTGALTGALAGAVAGCGVLRRTPEGSGPLVDDVLISGNRAFDDDQILARIATRGPSGHLWWWRQGRLDELSARVDRRRIEAFYRSRGYFSAAVSGPVLRPLPGGRVQVLFAVREGAPTRIGELVLAGAPPGQRTRLEAVLQRHDLRREAVFDYENYQLARSELAAALVQAGYLRAEVRGEVRVDRDRHVAQVILSAETGPQMRFGALQLVNGSRVPDSSLEGRVEWRQGEVYDPDKVQETRKQLYAMGQLSGIKIDSQQGALPGVVDMRLHASDGLRNELKMGGGLAIDGQRLEARGRLDYQRRHVFLPLVTLLARVRPGYVIVPERNGERTFVYEVRSELQRQDLFWTRLQASIYGGYERQLYYAFTILGPFVGTGFTRDFWRRRLNLSVGWQLHRSSIDPDDARLGEALAAMEVQRLAFYEQSAVLDLRDNPANPRRGLYLRGQAEEGGRSALGEARYFKLHGDLRGYVPVGGRAVLAARLATGALVGVGQEPPLTQRFYGGGPSDHRGFRIAGLSPAVQGDSGRVPVGGDGMVLISAEARLPTFKLGQEYLLLGLFGDAGDVTVHYDDIVLDRLHWAVGLGLRYPTPAGPVRLDLGIRLNRLDAMEPDGTVNPDPGRRLVLSFAVGESF
jgi:outer membrane protein assembly factor BamA